jgi:hypothetical protein
VSRKLPLMLALLLLAAAAPGGGRIPFAGSRRAEAQTVRPQFSAATLTGTCGFNAASTNVDRTSPGFLHPSSSFGTLAFNGVSAVTGIVTINLSGKLQTTTTTTGSYSVGADGRTGTMDFSAHGGSIYTFVIVGTSTHEIRYINSGPVDPKTGIIDVVTIATCKF